MRNLAIIAAVLLISFSCGKTHLAGEVKKLESYPSASGIEIWRGQFLVIGDDARHLLILDSTLSPFDSILLYPGESRRLSKETKPDLESLTFLGPRNQRQLLVMGSGSLSPYRNVAWLMNIQTKSLDSIRLDTFFTRLKFHGLKEINLEGSCAIPGAIIFSNRGHKDYRKNYLVITNQQFYRQQNAAPISLILMGSNPDTSVFNGISGIAYSQKSDRLIMTVSTEDTRSVYDDGAIGKSYLWIVNAISSKRNWKSINPNQVVELDALDARFKGQKIESVCVEKETKHFLHLVLAADNDDGTSTLFRVNIMKD